MKLGNLKIGTRLIMAFAIVLCMLVGVAVLGLTRMTAINDAMTGITKANDVEANLASDMKLSLDDRMIALRNIVLLDNPTQMQPEIDRVSEQLKLYNAAEEKLLATFKIYGVQEDEAKFLAEIRERSIAAQPLIQKIQELGFANKNADAIKLLLVCV